MTSSTDPTLRSFVDTMPRGYRYVFSERGMADHARLSIERGESPARVGRFHSRRELGADAICVIADDRPGLLALISAALVYERLDVLHAEAYTRRTVTGHEAVDVFWVRDLDQPRQLPIPDDRIPALEATLIALLRGERSFPETRPEPTASGPFHAVVRFLEGREGELTTLEVETIDRAGLLLALARALFERKVQIVRSEVHTHADRVHDRFELLELDGTAIGPERRLEIQVAVLGAIDPANPSVY